MAGKLKTFKSGSTNQKTISKTISEGENRVYQYLKKQLAIKRAQLNAIEGPLDPNKLKDERYVQEMILKSNIWQLEDELNAIEMILGINE